MPKASTKSKESSNMQNLKPTIIQFFVLVAAVAAAYYIGVLKTEVSFYEKGGLAANPQVANNAAAPTGPDDFLAPANVPGPIDGDFIYGNKDAKYALIEYSDFECPYCQSFHATAKQVVDDSDGEVMWVYRHFPLYQIHPGAEEKALAAECIAQQGGSDAFWSFADALYESTTTEVDLASLATELGYDGDALTTCVANRDTADLIDEDVSSAELSGVQGTPGNFMLNIETDEAVSLFGAVPADVVTQAIELVR